MARRKLPPGTKARAIEQIKAGIEPLKIALDCGVSQSTISKWKDELKSHATTVPGADSSGALPISPGHAPIATEPAIQTGGPGPDLSDMLRNHPGTGFSPPPVQPIAPPPAPPPKPMDPEALIGLAIVIKTMVVETASNAWKIKLEEDERKHLSEFSESELKALKILAPSAAEYSASLERYAKPVMACLFGGVLAFSTISSLRYLKSKIPPKPRNVMKKEPKK